MKRFQKNLSQVLSTLRFQHELRYLPAPEPWIIEIEDDKEEEEPTIVAMEIEILNTEGFDTVISNVAVIDKGKGVLVEVSEQEVTLLERYHVLLEGSTFVVDNNAYGFEVQLHESLTNVVLKTLEEFKQQNEIIKSKVNKLDETNSTITSVTTGFLRLSY